MTKNEVHYDEERSFWDEVGQSAYISLSKYDQDRIKNWINWPGNGRVLDIGGGSGMASVLLSGSIETEFVCVDISKKMLAYSPVAAVQANALHLPFPDNSFDLLVAAAFFHHLPGFESQLLKECYRVLAPNGRLIGYDPNALCIQNRIFMGNNQLRLSTFSPDERPISPIAFEHIAKQSGFADFNCFTFSFKNSKITIFELIQRYILNPISIGPIKRYLDRWFFWKTRKSP